MVTLTNVKTVIRFTGNTAQLLLQMLLFLLLPAVIFTLIISKTSFIPDLQAFVVQTGSMEPNIPVGSIIYTKKAIGYDVGDAIAFKNAGDQTITHRITGMAFADQTVYETKGDANKAKDVAPVPTDKVVGKVYLTVPYVGYLMNYLKTPQGFALFIIVPVTLFVLMELWGIKKEIERQVENRILEQFGDPSRAVTKFKGAPVKHRAEYTGPEYLRGVKYIS